MILWWVRIYNDFEGDTTKYQALLVVLIGIV